METAERFFVPPVLQPLGVEGDDGELSTAIGTGDGDIKVNAEARTRSVGVAGVAGCKVMRGALR